MKSKVISLLITIGSMTAAIVLVGLSCYSMGRKDYMGNNKYKNVIIYNHEGDKVVYHGFVYITEKGDIELYIE